mgnify:CR=1 FL=1
MRVPNIKKLASVKILGPKLSRPYADPRMFRKVVDVKERHFEDMADLVSWLVIDSGRSMSLPSIPRGDPEYESRVRRFMETATESVSPENRKWYLAEMRRLLAKKG